MHNGTIAVADKLVADACPHIDEARILGSKGYYPYLTLVIWIEHKNRCFGCGGDFANSPDDGRWRWYAAATVMASAKELLNTLAALPLDDMNMPRYLRGLWVDLCAVVVVLTHSLFISVATLRMRQTVFSCEV